MDDIKALLNAYDTTSEMIKSTDYDRVKLYRNIIKEAKLLLMKHDIPFANYGIKWLSESTLKGLVDYYISLLRGYDAEAPSRMATKKELKELNNDRD